MTVAVPFRPAIEGDVPPLSALEWKVVGLAMREPGGRRTAGRRTGLLARLFGRWTGGQRPGFRPLLPLADPRLEALRRFVAQVRDHADSAELGRRMIELGFHPGQVSALARLVR